MEVKLNRRDTIALLSRALGYDIKAKDLKIELNPLTITLDNFPAELLSRIHTPKAGRKAPPANTAPIPEEAKENEDNLILGLKELLNANAALQQQSSALTPVLGPNESYDYPG